MLFQVALGVFSSHPQHSQSLVLLQRWVSGHHVLLLATTILVKPVSVAHGQALVLQQLWVAKTLQNDSPLSPVLPDTCHGEWLVQTNDFSLICVTLP